MELLFGILTVVGAFFFAFFGLLVMEVARVALSLAVEPFARGLRSGSGVPTLAGIWAAAGACFVVPWYTGRLSVVAMIVMGVAAVLALTATVYWVEARAELPVPLPSDGRPVTKRTWSHHYSRGRWPLRGQ